MSNRAQERALQAFPGQLIHDRVVFKFGYEQAEKDLALTWKDICNLEEIINQVHYENPNGIGAQCFGEEVLQRFNESKK